MKVNDKEYRTVWMEGSSVMLIEQNQLPFKFEIIESKNHVETAEAITTMVVRGAGAIGGTAAYAMAQGFLEAPDLAAGKDEFWKYTDKAKKTINSARPTTQNLFHATARIYNAARKSSEPKKTAVEEAKKYADDESDACRSIGENGDKLIKDGYTILTHCNAGWLAFVDYGSALAPIYVAQRNGKKVQVYADETRPRSQGARLTAWELKNENVPHLILPDNAGAYFMSRGMVDMVIVGSDRIAGNGDVANKIGTFEKAIVAKEFGIPFYVAAPTSTIDRNAKSGADIPIEQRNEDEVLYMSGPTRDGKMETILVCSPGSHAVNPAFDVTPAKYVAGIITEKGIVDANEKAIQTLFED
jgi:S-methyl-5-thioribose-1-phosphate isomerase